MRRASAAAPCIPGQRSSSGDAAVHSRTTPHFWNGAPHPRTGGASGDIALHPGTATSSWRCPADPRMAPWIWKGRSASTEETRIWRSRRGWRDARRCPWMYGDVWRPGPVAREREEGERARHAPPERWANEVYLDSVSGAEVGVVESGVSGGSSGLTLRVRPRNGCMPYSASFSERRP